MKTESAGQVKSEVPVATLVVWWQREIQLLDRQIVEMKRYLALVISREDWHGVMDASADIRELIIKRSTFAKLITTLTGGLVDSRCEEVDRLLRVTP